MSASDGPSSSIDAAGGRAGNRGGRAIGGATRVRARFEPGHSKEEKMAAVHYVRFALPEAARAALADPGAPARVVVDHPNYRAEADLPAPMRSALVQDLTG